MRFVLVHGGIASDSKTMKNIIFESVPTTLYQTAQGRKECGIVWYL